MDLGGRGGEGERKGGGREGAVCLCENMGGTINAKNVGN